MFSIGTLLGVIGAAVGVIGLILGYVKKNSEDATKATDNGKQDGIMLTQLGAANKSLDDIKLDFKRECEKRQEERVKDARQYAIFEEMLKGLSQRVGTAERSIETIFSHLRTKGQYDDTDIPIKKGE